MIKLFRITTIPLSLNLLLKNQLQFLNNYFQVTAISSDGDDLYIVRDREKIAIIPLSIEREISVLKDFRSLFNLWITFLKHSPEIVHANTPKGSLLGMIAAMFAGVPYRIYTVTGLRFETETGIKKKVLIWMEKITCFCATQVVAESQGVQKMIYSNNLTRKKTVIIGNGNINGIDQHYWDPLKVDLSRKEQIRNAYDIQAEDFIFIFVGRLVGDKGINELVHAFDQLNNSKFKLLLVGAAENMLDPLQPESLEILNNNTSIITAGFQDDVRAFMSISNVLVLPSYREGFPNVVLQAGAMEIPCIVTNVNGAEDVIDGKNGRIVAKKDISELRYAMLDLFENYQSLDKSYCREKVVTNYSQEFYYPELLKFYQQVVN